MSPEYYSQELLISFKDFIGGEISNKSPAATAFIQMLPEELFHSLNQFAHENSSTWVSDMEMYPPENAAFKIPGGGEFSFHELFFYLSAEKQEVFWKFFCCIIGRDTNSLALERKNRVMDAATKFSQDLKNININMTADDLVTLVQENKKQISLRMTSLLVPPMPISKEDAPHFWAHFDTLYKLLYPYEVLSKPVQGLEILEDCVSGIISSGMDENSTPQDMLQKLVNPTTIEKVMTLVQNPDAISTIMNSFLPLLRGGQ